jgi:hypothetical protein
MSDEHELSDYLLGEASEQERLDLERRMEADPLLRDRVRRLEAVTDQLAALPGAAWDVAVDDRTEAAGAAERPPAGRRARRPLFGIPMPGFAVALVAVALFAAGLGTGALIIRGGGAASPTGEALTLRPLINGPADVSGVAYLNGADQMVLVINRLPVTASGRYYEAWLMTSIHKLVPLASFRVDDHGAARLNLRLPAAPTSYRYVDISLQSVSAGTGHSGTSVLRGPTS